MVLYHCKLGFKVIMKRLLHGSRLYITQIYYCTRNMSTVRPANPFEAISCEAGFIKEGSATIKFPKGEVFYNPVQQLNRDLSIIAINCFSEDYLALKKKRFLSGITVLEALAATGLRSIRYAKEISSASLIIANDMDPDAVKLINENIQLNSENDPNNRMNIIRSNCGDAIATMHKLKTEGINIDVIDLDPYGSAAPFLDSAVQNISDGGLLCVTCTDKVILCSSHHDTCFSRYGGIPIQGDSCHEAVSFTFFDFHYKQNFEKALRLVIQAVDSAANKYRKTVVPLMSCSIDFYVRIFLKIIESPATVKLSCTYVKYCLLTLS